MSGEPSCSLPRAPLALLSALHAAVFAWAGAALPWSLTSIYALGAFSLAAAHLATAACAVAWRRALPRVFGLASVLSLAAFAFVGAEVIRSAVYLATLYGGLGEGIAAALAAGLAPLALFTVPIGVFGLVATSRRRGRVTFALTLLVAVAAAGAASLHWAELARAEALPGHRAAARWPSELAAARREVLPRLDELPPVPPRRPGLPARAPSLHHEAPAPCVPRPGEPQARAVVTHLGPRGSGRKGPTSTCVVAPPERLAEAVWEAIRDDAFQGPVAVDVLVSVAPIETPSPLLDALALRPGLDGVCDDRGCLMPWQLVALGHFVEDQPIAEIPDFRFGVSAARLAEALGTEPAPNGAAFAGLRRLEARTFVLGPEGEPVELVRGRERPAPLTRARLERALEGAEAHVLAAQRWDGRFRYLLDPHTGRQPFARLNLPRQAGTTLVACELARDGERAREVAERSLSFMAAQLREAGSLLAPAKGERARASLGSIALPAIAFAACRSRVGAAHDAIFAGLVRSILALQREDGGFHPVLELERGAAVAGPEPLYAGGQAVFALVAAEALAIEEPGAALAAGLPGAAALGEAAERAMGYYAGPYYDTLARDFFWIEENWHCLAARAALAHRRDDAYERFCLDYVRFKARLILDEGSGVASELVGGYGMGNVFVPQNTPTAGFGEALAAALAIERARGEEREGGRALMARVAAFLVRQQWNETNCFACAPRARALGGFSESMVVADVRIDYTQHAWAALGHGREWIEDGLPPR